MGTFENKLVYICSPYSGDVEENVKRAQNMCQKAIDAGGNPLAPHLYYPQFLNDDCPDERELGLNLGIQLIKKCDVVYVAVTEKGLTAGMKAEIVEARRCRLDIMFRIDPEIYGAD